MNIVHLVSTFPPYHGGMGSVASNLAQFSSERGDSITVLTPAYDGVNREEQEGAVRVVRLGGRLKYGNAMWSSWILKWLNGFDVIHLHLPYIGGAELVWWGMTRKRFRNAQGESSKLVIHYHMDLVGRGIFYPFFFVYQRLVVPKLLKLAKVVLVTSLDYAQNSPVLAKRLDWLGTKVVELPNGVDANYFSPAPKAFDLLSRWRINSESKIILFVGALDKAHYFKGLEHLLEAFTAAQQTLISTTQMHLLIVGSGDRLAFFEDRVRGMGLDSAVTFAGNVSNEELPAYLNLADVLVLPSIDRSEAFGIVLLEAMASGKAVIATNLPGVRTLITNNVNGLLVPPGDHIKLSEALIDLLSNDALLASCGAQGRARVEQLYDWRIITTKLLEIYQQI